MEVKRESDVPEKKVEKVVSGNVKLKKKSGIAKFAGSVVQEDMQSVGHYIFAEVLIPALKKAISDVVTNGIDMLLYGESGKTRKSPGSKISYNSIYDERRKNYRKDSSISSLDYDDVIFESRGEAETILSSLEEIIDRYGTTTVADLYDLAGISINGQHTFNKYGWSDLRSASVVRVYDGYVIKFPRPLPID